MGPLLIGILIGGSAGILCMSLFVAAARADAKRKEQDEIVEVLQRVHDILYDRIVKQETYFKKFESSKAIANAYAYCRDQVDITFGQTGYGIK